MSTAVARRTGPARPKARRAPMQLGPDSAGLHLTEQDYYRADYEEGWKYELIDGVLVVSPTAGLVERDPNEELGHMLRTYQESQPGGHHLTLTVAQQDIRTKPGTIRTVDRVIYAGLERMPVERAIPTVTVEFVSKGKRNQQRDYEEKSEEYMAAGVEEYWIIDRFVRTLTVFMMRGGKIRKRVCTEKQIYSTPLLPGFELSLAKLLNLADRWAKAAS